MKGILPKILSIVLLPNISDNCARHREEARGKFDKLPKDVVALTLPQAAKREVGGRRTETE
jgi:hypothetical protein